MILGNSGSGKSTHARVLARTTHARVLDLDTVYWVPGKIAVERPHPDRIADVQAFCRPPGPWIVEGCYGDLAEVTFEWKPELVLLDPGLDACLRHCRQRPFEPHKYASREEQDRHLEPLLRWVAEYYERDGPLSHRGHRELFEQYAGPKRLIRHVDPT